MHDTSTNYRVFLNGIEQKINTALIHPVPYNENKIQEFVILKIEENAVLEIQTHTKVNSVTVRPLSSNICYTYGDHSIKIKLKNPQNFSLEINGSLSDNLLIFASKNKEYSFDGFNVIHVTQSLKKDRILIDKDNTALYIDDGVTLNSKIEINGCKNIKICGSGIVTQSGVSDAKYRICVDILGCSNVVLEDITITESLFWCIRLIGCDNVKINNVKIIGYRGNNDGIDVCGSRNIEVDGAFIRTTDDCLVVKAIDERDKKSKHYVVEGSPTDMTKAFERIGNVYNILFKNCILWNDFARPIEIGVSLRTDEVYNLKFKNIDIIHSTTGYPLIGAHHGDRADVHDVTISDIRIEDAPGAQLFDFRITDSEWSTDDRKGSIHDFLFKNISLIGKPGIDILPEASRLEGYSPEHSIRNFQFEDIFLLGRCAENAKQLNLNIMNYVDGISFKNTTEEKCIRTVSAKLQQISKAVLRKDGNYDINLLLAVENQSNERVDGEFYIKSSPKNSGKLKSKTAYSLAPGEKKHYRFSGVFPAGKHCLSVESSDIGVNSTKLLLDLPLYAPKHIDAAQPMYFTNYYGDCRPPIYIALDGNKLSLKSELIKKGELVLYTANPVPVRRGEVLFTAEETDFGESAALIMGDDGPISAPQLRCPAEVTYVFHNEPKVEKINEIPIPPNEDGIFNADLKELEINFDKEFLVEIQVKDAESQKYRYAYTLGHSVVPKELCHMFIRVKRLPG